MAHPSDIETDFPGAVPGRYWRALDDGRVECQVCPRLCKLHDGQRGLCFVRAAHQGQVVLTTYGRSSGFCVDPIEKKPLNHFLPGTPVFSFGTAGCNLTCKFCQKSGVTRESLSNQDVGFLQVMLRVLDPLQIVARNLLKSHTCRFFLIPKNLQRVHTEMQCKFTVKTCA